MIKEMDPTCLSQQFCLIARFIHGCSTAACLISQIFFFPGFFPNTWQLPDLLSSAPILKRLLLLLHTHTLLHIPLRERGGWLHDFLFCSPSPWFCPGAQESFTFSSAIMSLVHLGKKLTVTCTSPIPVSFISWSGTSSPCCCAPPAVLLCLYIKGDSGRFSLCHQGSCPCRGSTLSVLHTGDLSQHILRLHATTDVKSKNVYLSSGVDAAQ